MSSKSAPRDHVVFLRMIVVAAIIAVILGVIYMVTVWNSPPPKAVIDNSVITNREAQLKMQQDVANALEQQKTIPPASVSQAVSDALSKAAANGSVKR